MKKLFFLLFFSLFLLGCTTTQKTIDVNGLERSYLLHVPENPKALILVFHGGGGNAPQAMRHSRMHENTDFAAVAYLDAIENNWNDGRQADIYSQQQDVNDVEFAEAVISEVKKKYEIKQVFAAGISNGGMMSIRMACDSSVNGVAVIAAAMPEKLSSSCNFEKPVNAIFFIGDSDPLIPFEGGEIAGLAEKDRGTVLNAEETLNFWLSENACNEEFKEEINPVEDDTSVEKTSFSCVNSKIDYYLVKNGGHTWPSAQENLPELIVGKTTKDVDATKEALKFFKTLLN